VKNARWHYKNIVLLGDAAHTAHFSIGSGTKLAMEDAIALADALQRYGNVATALRAYEEARRPQVEATQRAAQVSLQWFEETERYYGRLPPIQFAFSLLTRSLRVTHENFKLRDPKLVETVNRWFAEQAAAQSGVALSTQPPPPPMFTPFRLRGLVLANRVVVSPMCQYSADDGTPNDWHLVNLGSRAVGGAGLVVAEMTDVSREGRISPGCTGMYKLEHVVAWRRIVDFVHAHSAAKIGIQLAHAGRKGSTRRLWEGIDEPLPDGNWPLVSASAIPYFPHSQVPKMMERADMQQVRDDFVRAARMAEEAGFDFLELHFAHGYLLSSFLSPLTNTRVDEYGGSLENRMRYPLEVFDAVRAVWPAAKPVSVKISATDWAEGGFTGDDAVAVAATLKAHGCDVITVSTGQTVPYARPVYGRLYQTPFSERIRWEAGMATMTVGNIASYADVNSILAAGRADLCALARAHLYDPYWTRHAAWEQGVELPWPDQYVSVGNFTPRR
jgi:anthraniloyl-CoA monooxygenase